MVVRLRRHFDKKRLKICFISSLTETSTVKKSLEVGGDDYLIKPVDKYILLHKVTKLLGETTPKFAWIGAECIAGLCQSNVMPEIRVLRIQETGIYFSSSAEIAVGTIFQIDCPSVSTALGKPFKNIIQRIMTCEKESASLYFVSTEFVGITEAVKQPIRSLAIQGKFISDP